MRNKVWKTAAISIKVSYMIFIFVIFLLFTFRAGFFFWNLKIKWPAISIKYNWKTLWVERKLFAIVMAGLNSVQDPLQTIGAIVMNFLREFPLPWEILLSLFLILKFLKIKSPPPKKKKRLWLASQACTTTPSPAALALRKRGTMATRRPLEGLPLTSTPHKMSVSFQNKKLTL